MKLFNIIPEAKNHMGENIYRTFSSWKRACRTANPNTTFEGDKEICNARPGVGEWDGETGCVYKSPVKEDVSDDASAAYEKRLQNVMILMGKIKQSIDTHIDAQSDYPSNWGFAGDLAHVEEELQEILEFLSSREHRE